MRQTNWLCLRRKKDLFLVRGKKEVLHRGKNHSASTNHLSPPKKKSCTLGVDHFIVGEGERFLKQMIWPAKVTEIKHLSLCL